MGAIQSSINSMIGSASHAVMAVKGYQALKNKKQAEATKKTAAEATTMRGPSPQDKAADRARQSAANEMDAKKKQKRSFMEYLKKEPISLGGKVGDLSPAMQKQVASQYTKSQRQRLMDLRDKEAQNGKH